MIRSKTFSQFFREVYYVGMLSPKDQVKFWLIDRYLDKVSSRLVSEKERLYKEGSDQFRIYLDQVTTASSFISRIKSAEGPWFIPVTFPLPKD